jgi:hypothetical protein
VREVHFDTRLLLHPRTVAMADSDGLVSELVALDYKITFDLVGVPRDRVSRVEVELAEAYPVVAEFYQPMGRQDVLVV